jgi:hypothetical protein
MTNKFRKTIIALAILAFSTPAVSGGSDRDRSESVITTVVSEGGNARQTSTNTNNLNNTNTVTGTNTVSGVSSNTVNITQPADTRTTVRYENEQVIKNTPNFAVASIFPSAACHGTSSAAISLPGLGIGGGSSWRDPDCGIRETARLFDAMGLRQDAVAVICSSVYAKSAPSCRATEGR